MIYSKIPKTEILEIIERIGPVIPMDIVKLIGLDTTIIGAVLAELEDSKKIKRTFLRKGSSPYYYTEDQISNLEKLSEILKSKDKETFEILKKEKVLRSVEIDPLTRVSLQKLKDFAVPINVQNPKTKETELYYQYFLATEEEILAKLKAKSALYNKSEGIQKDISKIQKYKNINVQAKIEQPKDITYNKPRRKQIKKKVEDSKQLHLIQNDNIQQKIEEHQEESEFLSNIMKIFKEKNIEIIDLTKIKKDEYDMEIIQSTPLGKINFFCKAKSKKKINEADLSIAYLSALKRHLSVVYVSNGELSKKLEQNLEKDFTGLVYYKI